MTIHERMIARSEREKDLLKYGRSQERQHIIKLLEDFDFSTIWRQIEWSPDGWESFGSNDLIALIKGENK